MYDNPLVPHHHHVIILLFGLSVVLLYEEISATQVFLHKGQTIKDEYMIILTPFPQYLIISPFPQIQ